MYAWIVWTTLDNCPIRLRIWDSSWLPRNQYCRPVNTGRDDTVDMTVSGQAGGLIAMPLAAACGSTTSDCPDPRWWAGQRIVNGLSPRGHRRWAFHGYQEGTLWHSCLAEVWGSEFVLWVLPWWIQGGVRSLGGMVSTNVCNHTLFLWKMFATHEIQSTQWWLLLRQS